MLLIFDNFSDCGAGFQEFPANAGCQAGCPGFFRARFGARTGKWPQNGQDMKRWTLGRPKLGTPFEFGPPPPPPPP